MIDYFCAFVEYLRFFPKIHFPLFFKFSVISPDFLIIPKKRAVRHSGKKRLGERPR